MRVKNLGVRSGEKGNLKRGDRNLRSAFASGVFANTVELLEKLIQTFDILRGVARSKSESPLARIGYPDLTWVSAWPQSI